MMTVPACYMCSPVNPERDSFCMRDNLKETPIVTYGPFIGDSKQDIARLFTEYQAGDFPRLSELRKQQGSSRPHKSIPR